MARLGRKPATATGGTGGGTTSAAIGGFVSAISGAVGALQRLVEGLLSGATAAGSAAASVAASAAPASAASAAASAATSAVGTFVGAISGAVGQVQQFVQALSPSTMQIFGQAVRDLQATIGQAFQPAFIALANVVRSVADQLSPLMQQLAPVIQQVVEAVGVNLVRGVNAAVGVFQAVLPALETLLTFVTQVGQVFQGQLLVSVALLTAVLTPVVALFQSLKPVLDVVTKAVQEFARNLIRVIAGLMALVGWTEGLRALLAAFKPRESGHVTAAGPTQITGLEEITKQLAMSAAQARGGMPGKTQDEWLASISSDIEKILDNGPSLRQFLLQEFVPALARVILGREPPRPELASGQGRSVAGRG